MPEQEWVEADAFIVDALVGDDPQLTDVLAANAAAELPTIDVSPAQGKLLSLLARTIGARRVLEIGTLGGYSTLWFARAVGESGTVVTLEYEPKHAAVARANLDHAGVGDRCEIRVGAALDTLPQLDGVFDLVFIDADKPNNANYVEWALRLTRPGSVIIVDNAIARGQIITGATENGRACRELVELLRDEPRLDATVIQTVGAKGWDGFAYALVVA